MLIDSIVYERYENASKTVKAINTYIKGKKVFENIVYNENETIRTYQFFDTDCSDCLYRRDYDSIGNLISTNGKYLFQCNTDKIDTQTLSIKKGTTLKLKLFYANPPDCMTFTNVKFSNNKKADVFYQNKHIRFLKTVTVENDNIGSKKWKHIEIEVVIKDTKNNKTDTSSGSLFYQVTS